MGSKGDEYRGIYVKFVLKVDRVRSPVVMKGFYF